MHITTISQMTEYYIIDNNGNQIGPISEVLFPNYGVNASTLVWREGMAEWKQASELPELKHLFVPPVPPVVPPPIEPQQNQAWGQTPNGWNQSTQSWTPPVQNQYQQNQYTLPCPPTYLAWALISTILCCIPFGVIALIQSSKVQSQWQQGDYNGAMRASKSAKDWSIASFASGFFIYGLYIFASFLGVLF